MIGLFRTNNKLVNPIDIKKIDPNDQTESMCWKAVNSDCNLIQYCHKQTEKMCRQVVKEDYTLIQYCKVRTSKVYIDVLDNIVLVHNELIEYMLKYNISPLYMLSQLADSQQVKNAIVFRNEVREYVIQKIFDDYISKQDDREKIYMDLINHYHNAMLIKYIRDLSDDLRLKALILDTKNVKTHLESRTN